MASFKKFLVLVASIATSVYTFYVMGKFALFLSLPKQLNAPFDTQWIFNLLDNSSRLEAAAAPIITDYMLIALFVVQHSLMKTTFITKITESLGFQTAHRTIYCVTSSLCLHALVHLWLPAQSVVLWQFDAQNPIVWWAFVLVHAFAWLLIYGGCIIMDLPELLGVKQAYNDFNGCAAPSLRKSYELQHLYENVRHPSLVGFVIVLWLTNMMTLDRFLLSVILTIYMGTCWATDETNVLYQQKQYKRKVHSLH